MKILKKHNLVLFACSFILAFSTGCQNETDLANEAVDSREGCALVGPFIGRTGTFSNRDHNVGGTATIISGCEIEITNFSFDGGGRDVRVYGAATQTGSAFRGGVNLSPEDLRSFGGNGDPNFRSTFRVTIPEGFFFEGDPENTNPTTANVIDALSIWCVPFDADFGSLTFN